VLLFLVFLFPRRRCRAIVSWRCRPIYCLKRGTPDSDAKSCRGRGGGFALTSRASFFHESPPDEPFGSRCEHFPQMIIARGEQYRPARFTGKFIGVRLRPAPPHKMPSGNNSSHVCREKFFSRAEAFSRTIPHKRWPLISLLEAIESRHRSLRMFVPCRINSCVNTQPIAQRRRFDRTGHRFASYQTDREFIPMNNTRLWLFSSVSGRSHARASVDERIVTCADRAAKRISANGRAETFRRDD